MPVSLSLSPSDRPDQGGRGPDGVSGGGLRHPGARGRGGLRRLPPGPDVSPPPGVVGTSDQGGTATLATLLCDTTGLLPTRGSGGV